MSLCPRHHAVRTLLAARLGRAHQGGRITRRTMTAISKQCPNCQEKP